MLPIFMGTVVGAIVPAFCSLSTPFGSSDAPCAVKLRWIGHMVAHGALAGYALNSAATYVAYTYFNTVLDPQTCVILGTFRGACALAYGASKIRIMPYQHNHLRLPIVPHKQYSIIP